MQTTQVQTSLNQARLLLEDDRSEAARAIIDTIQTDNDVQQRDVAYLLGWYYVINKQWAAAVQTLSPLLAQNTLEDTQETLLERERLVLYLLHLGKIAVNLAHYEDASQHFIRCLKLLHDRRIQRPALRIEARYSLAMTYVMRGSYAVALSHYEDALRLCRHYELDKALPDIYYGMSEAYRCMGNTTNAYGAAQKALHIYEEHGDEVMQSRIGTVLGRISLLLDDVEGALNYYKASYALATSNKRYTMVMLSSASLAEVYAEIGNKDEAREYTQHALEVMRQVDDPYLCGIAYAAVGKVRIVEAHLTDGTKRQSLIDEGILCLQKAVKYFMPTQASRDLAQTYSTLATIHEELGRSQEALEYWKLAYIEKDKAKNIPCAQM